MEALQLVKYSGSRQLLQTLLKFPDRRFTINELANEARVPFSSAWRLVKKWEMAGIIETGKVGNGITVRLHKSEYVDSVASLLRISTSPQAFSAHVLKGILAEEKGVREAHLFGSVAKGTEMLQSDIDVALLCKKDYDANRLVFGIYEKYGTKVVPLAFSSKRELEGFMAGKKGVRLK